MGIRAHLTDRLCIEADGTVVDEADLPGHQGRLALAYLLVEHRRPVPRDELADLLWGGSPPGSWEKGLAVVVSKLRAALAGTGLGEGALTHAFGCYRLHVPSDAWIDVEAASEAVEVAEQALAQGDPETARSSASVASVIARRLFLPGAEGLWVEAKRSDLVVILRRSLHCIGAAALALGDPAAAATAATEAIALEPFREEAYLLLIRAQAAAGNRADALHTYERCRRLLVEELGVNPSSRTEAAYLELLDADGHGTAPSRRAAPERVAPLVNPPTRYAKDGDVYVAYHVFGADAPDLLLFSSAMIAIDCMNDEPALARFHQRLGSFRRVIRFDLRGVGLSDSVSASNPPTLEQWMQDALSVLDDAGSERAALFCPRDSGLIGIMLAATHPERVSSLIIANGSARYPWAEDYPDGIAQDVLDQFLELNFDPNPNDEGYEVLDYFAPTVAHDDAFRLWWKRAGAQGGGPATARLINRVYFQSDVRALLPLVRVPTLVLHRRDDAATPAALGRYLADHIPDAKYVELPGADNLYWVGDAEPLLDEIEEFLTGVRPAADTDGVLATVVFAAVEGTDDGGGRDVVEQFDGAVSRALERFRGRASSTGSNGLLATFDGPVRAVRCAQAIRDAASQLGLTLRVGAHIGEIDARGVNADNVTIRLATQIAACAAPRQVLVSRTVVDVIVGSGIELSDRGERVLDGAPGSWQLFEVAG